MKPVLVFLAVVLLTFSCKEKKEAEDKTQMEEVMIIHDEVMNQMGHLTKLTAELKEKVTLRKPE